MTRQSLKRRLERLEKLNGMKDKPTIVIVQCLDDPDLYHISGKPGDMLPTIDAPNYQFYSNGNPGERWFKQDLIDKLEKDYTVIVVSYVKDWRGGENV